MSGGTPYHEIRWNVVFLRSNEITEALCFGSVPQLP
jgi:hypothetical protein